MPSQIKRNIKLFSSLFSSYFSTIKLVLVLVY